MDLETLRAIQSPLKEKYRQAPQEAIVQLHAQSQVFPELQQSVLSTFAGELIAGLHPSAGGSGEEACSAEMLLEALIACAGVTLGAVATNMQLAIASAKVKATGTLDFRGTLGVDRNAPVGLTQIQLQFEIESAAPEESIAKLIELTERYCVIYQTLKQGVEIRTVANVRNG